MAFSRYGSKSSASENTRPNHRPKQYTDGKRTALNVMMYERDLDRLRAYCKKSGFTQTKVVNDIILEFLDKEGC